jgi:hypothetical protein
VSHADNAGNDSVSPESDGNQVEEALDELGENFKWRRFPDIRLPSLEEQKAHFLTHDPYRSWCEHCVRGKGKLVAFARGEKDEERKLPEIHVDYCFLGTKENNESKLLAILVAERETLA